MTIGNSTCEHVSKIFINPDYCKGFNCTTKGDLGLIKLKKPIEDIDFIPILTADVPDNTTLKVLGWGAGKECLDCEIAKGAEMAKISNDYCQYLFNVTAFDPGFKPKILHDERCSNAIDQKYPMFDCRGDSGGPAFVEIEGSFSLHSVVSSGIGICGDLPFSNGTGTFYPPTIK